MSPGKDETHVCGYIYIYIYTWEKERDTQRERQRDRDRERDRERVSIADFQQVNVKCWSYKICKEAVNSFFSR